MKTSLFENKTQIKRRFATFVAFLLFGAPFVPLGPLGAQQTSVDRSGGVVIRNGGAIRGVVQNPDASSPEMIAIEPSLGGKIELDASEVERSSTASPDEISYRYFAPLQKDDVASHLKIAKWATERGLSEAANAHYERVVELDSENEEARRALRHVKIDGVWVSKQERMEQNGWVRFGGRTVSQQEAALEERRRQDVADARYWKKEVALLYENSLNGDASAREALRRIRNPLALGPLVGALNSEKAPEGRVLLVQAIGAIGTAPALGELGRVALQDDDLDVRAAAVEGIYRKKTALSDAIEFFRRTLRTSDDVATINRAAYALGQFGEERAIPDLINALITSHKRQIVVGSDQTGATFSNGQLGNFSAGGGAKVKTISETFQNETVRQALVQIVGVNYQTPVDFGFNVDAWIVWRREAEQLANFYPRRDR